jgi:hypothetical protein
MPKPSHTDRGALRNAGAKLCSLNSLSPSNDLDRPSFHQAREIRLGEANVRSGEVGNIEAGTNAQPVPRLLLLATASAVTKVMSVGVYVSPPGTQGRRLWLPDKNQFGR